MIRNAAQVLGIQLSAVLPSIHCDERAELQRRFHEAFRVYVEAVRELEPASRVGYFEEAFDIVEGAKVDFLRACFELNKHMRTHGCGAVEEAEAATVQ